MTQAESYLSANVWLKIHYIGALFLLPIYFNFVDVFLGKSSGKLTLSLYGWGLLLGLLNIFTDFLAVPTPNAFFNFYTNPGPLYFLFVAYLIPTIGYPTFRLFFSYRNQDAGKKNQILYLFAGTCLGWMGGLSTLLPVFGFSPMPFGIFLVFAYVGIVAYAIRRHRLMDISIFVRKTLVYSSVIALLMAIYLSFVAVFAKVFEGFSGYQTTFSSALAAALISFCFHPVRKRIQSFVDAKFFRQYVDREEKLYELSRDVVTHTTTEGMAAALQNVLNETLHPKCGVLYLRGRNSSDFIPVSGWGNFKFETLSEDHPLLKYLSEHPQPFVLDEPSEAGASHSTRGGVQRRTA